MQLPRLRRRPSPPMRGGAPTRPADHGVWRLVHAERRALIDDLATLTPEQWATPSLAPGWTVHDVASHLIDNARTTPWRITVGMVRARGDLDRQNQAGVEAERRPTPAATLDALRSWAGRTSGPPTWMAPVASRLVEEIAHGEDIRRPLGIRHFYPIPAVQQALAYQLATPVAMGGAPAALRQVRLVATDAAVTIGEGPEVQGRLLELLMAATGRPWREGSLTGDGVALLAA
ncbi:maleylpyruvate isomerase family mycothiol-dependent enzyme [Kytococcus sedentarius]|uniref:maleylpyruvate isomerase family mycothiol-dependent enzyme n=1 Tax=Kytococcus sedentarius TaxID=1276 RepID=UPI0035BBBCA3